MAGTSDDEILIRRYLLGNVTDEEQSRVEERLLINDHYFNLLDAAEEDLIDGYVREALDAGDRLRFERHFLRAPGRAESVQFSRVLNACVARRIARSDAGTEDRLPDALATPLRIGKAGERRTTIGYVSAIALLLLALGVALLLVETRALRREIGRSRADMADLEKRKDELQQRLNDQIALNENSARELERQRMESSKIEQELSDLRSSMEGSGRLAILSVTLLPGESRGQERSSRLKVSPDIREVRLSLAIEEPLCDRYVATLQTSELETVLTSPNLKLKSRGGNTVTFVLPARLLTRSNYLVRLSGITGSNPKLLDSYFFTVVHISPANR